jgi:hypothetical protein
MAAFEYTAHGRNRRTMAALAAVLAGLIGLRLILGATAWLLGAIALTTLPAFWDLWSNRESGLRLDGDALTWHSGRRKGRIELHEIAHMRFDRRFDFSMRVSVVLTTGRKIRLPYETLPPRDAFTSALQDRGIDAQQHPFSIL